MQEEGPGACKAGKRDLQPCQFCHPEERDESLWAYIHASVTRGNKHLLGVMATNNICTCMCAQTRVRCVHPREVNSGNARNCTGEFYLSQVHASGVGRHAHLCPAPTLLTVPTWGCNRNHPGPDSLPGM